MRLSLTRTARVRRQSLSRQDRLALAGIWGAALICFVLLAWGHLGLGAWLVPPAASPQQQIATAGPYRVTLRLDSGQLTTRGPNVISFALADAAGHPIDGATLVVAPSMVTMAMDTQAVAATASKSGVYEAHPVFAMAGEWRLRVTITPPGQPGQTATFRVGARWNP